jgi:peptidoglycan/LPS O-acetylase OafA/YrhL
LTGLRGLAALWVILFHLFLDRNIPVIQHGYAGVDIFFLLSGFVLSHVYLRDHGLTTMKGYMRFLGVRLARIYPLHFCTLLCLLLMVVALPKFTTPYSHPEARFGDAAFIANLFLVQNWGLWWPGNWNNPSWSLSAEWFAYLAFPFLLMPLRRISSKRLLVALAIGVLASMVAMLYLAGYRATEGTGLAGMVRMACEFIAGCLLYSAFARGWRLWAVPSLSLMFVLLGIGMLLPSCGFMMVFAFVLMVVLAAQGHNVCARALQWRPATFLGEISFSLYLTHWIVIQVFNWLGKHGLQWEITPAAIATLLVVFALSVATYHLIEMPARKWGRRLALANPEILFPPTYSSHSRQISNII